MNFFKKIFQTEDSEDPTIDDKTSTKACIALLLETSMAAEILDESELMALQNTLQKASQINEDEIDELIALAKENIEDFKMAEDKFQKLDGIMVGRAAYDLPFKLFDVDRIFYNSTETNNSLISVIDEMFEYIETLNFKDAIKTKFHMLNLFKGLNNAKRFRLLLLSNEKNDKIKSELKNILLASENQAA